MNNNFLDFKIPENYGKGIIIIASDTFKSFLREKGFTFHLHIILYYLYFCYFYNRVNWWFRQVQVLRFIMLN